MKKYHIEIQESYQKTIEVYANTKEEAEMKYYDLDEGEEVYNKTINYDFEITEVE